MKTIEDIRNPKRQSGFDHVNSATGGSGPNGEYAANRNPRWRAYFGQKDARWHRGPARSTPEEAAQDYCDYINNGGVKPAPKLNYPQRPQVRRERLSDDPEVAAALGVLKDARAQRKGMDGYVYAIGEKGVHRAVKIGYSVKPEARVIELQTGNPRELVLLAKMKGTTADEKRLHEKYAAHNLIGEWFRKTPGLLDEFRKGTT